LGTNQKLIIRILSKVNHNNVNKYKKMLDFIALETYNCNAEVILYEVYFGSIKEDIYALFI
ncbi:MAG: hypothetical protein ACI35S_08635, partial [Anaeroplasma sp.]